MLQTPPSASPELSNGPRRRRCTAQNKLRILADTNHAAASGGIGGDVAQRVRRRSEQDGAVISNRRRSSGLDVPRMVLAATCV